MAYSHTSSKGVTYYLHSTEVTLRGGTPQTILFFAKVEKNAKGQPVELPADRVIMENPRNGFLTVRRKHGNASARPPRREEVTALTWGEQLEEINLPIGRVKARDGTDFTIESIKPLYASSSIRVAVLRDIVESSGVEESDLQSFLQDYPEFIPGDYFEIRPQVILELANGETQRPDFMLRPVEDLWDVLEIKRPDVQIITKSRLHPHPTAALTKATQQARNYAEALEQDDVRQRLWERYGIRAFKPRLQLIFGRSQGLDREHLRGTTHAATQGISMYTWDDVIEIAERKGPWLPRWGS